MEKTMKFNNNSVVKNKRRVTPIFQLLLFTLFAALAISQAGCREESQPQEPVGYYTCPMHPQVISHEPGECPICGMTLVYQEPPGEPTGKKEEQEYELPEMKNRKSGGFQFNVAANILVNSGLMTAGAEKKEFVIKSNYSAHIDFNEDPDRLVMITTKYDGWVEKLFVSKEGQVIQKGEPLLGVYSPQILAAKEEYLTTYQSLKAMYAQGAQAYGEQSAPTDLEAPLEMPDELAQKLQSDPTLKASRQKLRYLDVPEGQIKEMEETGAASRLTYYHSPIGGVIVKKEVLQGAYIKPGQEIFRIANLNTLWAFIHIFEKDLDLVEKGSRVILKTAAYPDVEIHGRIDLVYPFLEKSSKDIKVRIVVPNPGGKIKPGMFANVVIETRLPGMVITIPESALIYSGETNYLFVSLGGGSFELRPVEVRLSSRGEAVISSGLSEGEQVVVNGQFLLDSEASLKEAVYKGGAAGKGGGGDDTKDMTPADPHSGHNH